MILGRIAPRRLVRPLLERDFQRVWFGQVVSALGDPLQAVALAFLILRTTGSAAALGAVLGVPAALGIHAGSFGLAALATRSLRPVPRLPGDERSSPLREALEGFRAVTAQRWLMALLSVEALATFAAVGSISIGLPLL